MTATPYRFGDCTKSFAVAPIASTTRSAKSILPPSLTPVTRLLSDVPISACTGQLSHRRTFGKLFKRSRTVPSRRGRLAHKPSRPLVKRLSYPPPRHQRISRTMSAGTAPACTSWSDMPGNNASRTLRPLAKMPRVCRLCGTPRRCSPTAGKLSRSTRITYL